MNTPFAYSETMRLAFSLRHSDAWIQAIEQLSYVADQATREGLIELLHHPPTARAAVTAVTALEIIDSQPVIEALHKALDSPHVSVRLAVIRALHKRNAQNLAPVVSRLLEREPSWMIRKAALEFLAENPTDRRWDILKTSTDPHWRVRHALIRVLLNWSDSDSQYREIERRLLATGSDVRTQGILRYLAFRHTQTPPEAPPKDLDGPETWCGFWDWDPAVLAWQLEEMSPSERGEHIAVMPRLIGHEDERVRRWASHAILRDGEESELLETLRWLDDPRHSAYETVNKLTMQLDSERIELLVRRILSSNNISPGQWIWALDQIETTVLAEDLPSLSEFCKGVSRAGSRVRSALVRMLCRTMMAERQELISAFLRDPNGDVVLTALVGIAEWGDAEKEDLKLSQNEWQSLLESDDPEIRTATVRVLLGSEMASQFASGLMNDSLCSVRRLVAAWLVKQVGYADEVSRLQQDQSSHVRAAALTVSRAGELLEEPTKESSWYVLECAARLCKTPLWSLAPETPTSPLPKHQEKPIWTPVHRNAKYTTRSLAGFDVSPLGISGHYGLPVEGFQSAMETGINLMFWEPNYQTLTDFMGRVAPDDRAALRMVVGTFEASPARIRKDVERALVKLQIEQIAVFLLFWTRSWNRVTDSVRGMMDQLQKAGMIATYGLSTHSRPLAVEAIETGWNPVMVRHSAAHRGAESAIFPIAQKHDTGLLTFNNTCYGRLLDAFSADEELSPADCYRYTLGFEAVTACWSAPATFEELQTNLAALHSPELSPERCQRLREVGNRVYLEDSVFRQQVRGVP